MRGTLTPAEHRVLELVVVGKPNKIVAYELGLAEATIKAHMRTIMKKYGASNRTQVAYLHGQEQRA